MYEVKNVESSVEGDLFKIVTQVEEKLTESDIIARIQSYEMRKSDLKRQMTEIKKQYDGLDKDIQYLKELLAKTDQTSLPTID